MDACQEAIALRAKSSQAARLLHLQVLKHNAVALDFVHGIHGRVVGSSLLFIYFAP